MFWRSKPEAIRKKFERLGVVGLSPRINRTTTTEFAMSKGLMTHEEALKFG